MPKFFIYMSLLCPVFSMGQVAELRAVLEQDLKVQMQILELKKEQNSLQSELELAMQNTKALIATFEAKTQQEISKNEELSFEKKRLLSEIDATRKNLHSLEGNIAKIYQDFKDILPEIPLSLRADYQRQIAEIDKIAYANSSEKNLAVLKFLTQVSVDSSKYKLLGADCLVFGLNTEFNRQGASGDVLKLFKIIDGEIGYEVLELELEKGSK